MTDRKRREGQTEKKKRKRKVRKLKTKSNNFEKQSWGQRQNFLLVTIFK